MTKQVVVIDKKEWDDLISDLSSFRGIYIKVSPIHTITLDDDIENRANELLFENQINQEEIVFNDINDAIYVHTLLKQMATEQQIISEMKMKKLMEWCSINGWYFYSKDNKWRKHGNCGFEYLTTTELIDKFNTPSTFV